MIANEARQDKYISWAAVIALIPITIAAYVYYKTYGDDHFNLFLGGIVTIALYSTLYRENPIYRFAEHIFIGLGVGYSLMIAWTEIISTKLFDPIKEGQWMWLWMIPLAIMAYFVFSRKHGWISRIPLGILIGLSAGQAFQAFAQQYFPQIRNSFKPFLPNTMKLSSSYTSPPGIGYITIDRAVSNGIFLVTLLAVLTYFFFAFEQKNKGVRNFAQLGRWLIMIGFGAIFGSTMMTRFALLVDRMYFILIEWLHFKTRTG